MKKIIFLCLLAFPVCLLAQNTRISLDGNWLFALDPVKIGEQHGWTTVSFPDRSLDKVTVPHSFSVDKRYFFHTGTAWYFKKFETAALPKGYRAYIKFDAVFYKTKIWLNGQRVGEHEGGYTPFELDVTDRLEKQNTLTVQVNNEWDTTTIPGAKTVDTMYKANSSQLYAWMNYGGIIKPVQLIIRPDIHLENIRVFADPDLKKGTARINITAIVKNLSPSANQTVVNAEVYSNGKKHNLIFRPVKINIPVNEEAVVSLEAILPAKEVKLWSHDDPNLYKARVFIPNDTISTTFGIRKVEIRGTQLLLNGEPVRMGGANRPTDYPGLGSLDPDSVIERDLTLMKSGGMELSRIAHHAVSEKVLEWADKNGMLIITEAGNWQMTPKQMADPLLRKKYQSQLKEMIQRDWNHPSVIAYSLGNEFYSQTQEGKDWVKDMSVYTKTIDSTRLITFASYIVWRDYIKKPEDEASQYVDFISANVYGNHLKCVQHIHEIYPDKPIYVAEFGIRATPNKTEQDRINYLTKAMDAFRQVDYVIGASVWSFNDYLSRYPETDPDGYRAWGLVNAQRIPRGMYYQWQQEFSPASLEIIERKEQMIRIKVTARKDFPSYTLKGYQLRVGGKNTGIKNLAPGESAEISIALPASDHSVVELIKPGGFVILKKDFKR